MQTSMVIAVLAIHIFIYRRKEMDKKINKYIAVAYKLYTSDNGKEEMIEEATNEKPFMFISGLGLALDDFEKKIEAMEKGANFDFTLSKEQAYGEHEEERVLSLDREMFCIDGKLDTEHVFVDAIIPLQNENGQRFLGKVLEVGNEKVRVDLNHPLAGKELHFVGSVIESREATNEEIQNLINHMNGGCGGNCGGCHGDCGGDCGGHEGGCEGGCGHCH